MKWGRKHHSTRPKRLVHSTRPGFTLVEYLIATTVLAVMIGVVLQMFSVYYKTTVDLKMKAAALDLSTNRIELLRNMPYDNLAVEGGPIVAPSYLEASYDKTTDGITYTVKTDINYVDDAYDKCASYQSTADKLKLCRNSTETSPGGDTNPADYKTATVTVTTKTGRVLSAADTDISSRVAETASATGSIYIKVVDASGNPVPGATVIITKGGLTIQDVTDANGIAIFYNVPPGTNYVAKASKNGYSTIWTVAPKGSLQPYFPNITLPSQQTATATLTIMPQGANSLIVEVVDQAGNPLPNTSVYIKGGYKMYTNEADTTYYFDYVKVPLLTDSRGITVVKNSDNLIPGMTGLPPGNYYFCGDAGQTACQNNSTGHYLTAAIPYTGSTPFSPVVVPQYHAGVSPEPSILCDDGYAGSACDGQYYLQKARIVLAPISSAIRVESMEPGNISLAGDASSLSSLAITINGSNLNGFSQIYLKQGATTYPLDCDSVSNKRLSCTADLTGVQVGVAGLEIIGSGSKSLYYTPGSLGGLIVNE